MNIRKWMSKVEDKKRKLGRRGKRLSERDRRKIAPAARIDENSFVFIVFVLNKTIVELVVHIIFLFVRGCKTFVFISNRKKKPFENRGALALEGTKSLKSREGRKSLSLIPTPKRMLKTGLTLSSLRKEGGRMLVEGSETIREEPETERTFLTEGKGTSEENRG